MAQRVHHIRVTERELRVILSAFDLARDESVNPRARWWWRTQFANKLYFRLRGHV